MKVFCHHVYEYKKGLRSLILHTTSEVKRDMIENKLKAQEIDYVIYPIKMNKINIFFGDRRCIDVIKKIGDKPLNHYTAEEDFILGIMLGYDRVKQCERYLKIKEENKVYEILAG